MRAETEHITFSKPKKVKKSSVKKKAWAVFSKYIRHKYAKAGGYVECYTCDNEAPISEMQAGHGIPGRNNAVLFLEAIVKPQDVACNIYRGGNLAVFTRKLIEELGLAEYDRLVQESRRVVHYTTADYEAIYKFYSERLKEL